MTSVWIGIANELREHYPSGRRLVAVTGADPGRSREAADAFADALMELGETVLRADSDGTNEELREQIVAPFRADRSEPAVLVVSGPSSLVDKATRGMWHFILWQLEGDEPPHAAASALVDLSDPAAPTRRFADYCALPTAYES